MVSFIAKVFYKNTTFETIGRIMYIYSKIELKVQIIILSFYGLLINVVRPSVVSEAHTFALVCITFTDFIHFVDAVVLILIFLKIFTDVW